jgi:hypothetical protein
LGDWTRRFFLCFNFSSSAGGLSRSMSFCSTCSDFQECNKNRIRSKGNQRNRNEKETQTRGRIRKRQIQTRRRIRKRTILEMRSPRAFLLWSKGDRGQRSARWRQGERRERRVDAL